MKDPLDRRVKIHVVFRRVYDYAVLGRLKLRFKRLSSGVF